MSAAYPDKRFFRLHPLDKMSAALLADFKLTMEENDPLQTQFEEVVLSMKPHPHEKELQRDREIIAKMDSGEAVVAYMRQEHNGLADADFHKKALTLAAEAMPLILRRYKTSWQDRFIEHAFCLFAKSDPVYGERLFREYREIRNPYAQADACLLFGELGMKETVPFLMQEYERFQREFPDESFHQHPLLALYILCGEKGGSDNAE